MLLLFARGNCVICTFGLNGNLKLKMDLPRTLIPHNTCQNVIMFQKSFTPCNILVSKHSLTTSAAMSTQVPQENDVAASQPLTPGMTDILPPFHYSANTFSRSTDTKIRPRNLPNPTRLARPQHSRPRRMGRSRLLLQARLVRWRNLRPLR